MTVRTFLMLLTAIVLVTLAALAMHSDDGSLLGDLLPRLHGQARPAAPGL